MKLGELWGIKGRSTNVAKVADEPVAQQVAYEGAVENLNELYGLSQQLAEHFLEPQECIVGIYELLLNAIEHGNLGIGFEEKEALLRQRRWHEEVVRRFQLPENATKKVSVKLVQDVEICRLTITDQGRGFDWRDYIGRAPDVARVHGRGIWIAMRSGFDEVQFNDAGNEVTCVRRLRAEIKQA